jgi:hypothetical protein
MASSLAGMGVLACGLAALLLAGSGSGSRELETTLQDDALLLNRPPALVRQTARTIAALGVDRVRITAGWSVIAPSPRAREKPGRPFRAFDPSTYPRDAWDRLDTAVDAARDHGLEVMLDIGFWAPRWAVPRASRNPARERYAPDPAEFAHFAEAVARRYGGRVGLFTTWNEPNHPSFLSPQWRRTKRGRVRPASPHVYRALHEAAYTAIKRVRPQARVLIGGTSSTGQRSGRGGVPPLRFVRELACVTAQLEPLTVRECAGYKPLRADGYAHHPYSKTIDPAALTGDPDDAPLGEVAQLSGLLQALAERGRVERKLPLFLTEYGYESRPDDPFAPFDRDEQARHLAKASYLAWRDHEVQMFAQFLLRDIHPLESGRPAGTRGFYRDWQTGLYGPDGDPKPALQAFKLPFWAEVHERDGQRVVLAWGQVRPGRGRQTVRVEQQAPDGSWVAVRTYGESCQEGGTEFLTDTAGSFLTTLPAAGPQAFRMAWRRGDGVWEASVPVTALPAGAT